MFSIFHQICFGNFFPPICLSSSSSSTYSSMNRHGYCASVVIFICVESETLVLIRKPYPSFVVAIVVGLSGRIGLALPLWSSGKVNNNLESINVTNRENRARGKRNNSFSSSSLKITNQGTPAPGRKFTKQF